MGCIHTNKNSPHYKRKVRPGFENKCLACFSYGVYARHRVNRGLNKPRHNNVWEPIPGTHDLEQFREGYDALGTYAEEISYPPGLWSDPKSNPCVPLRPVHPKQGFFDIFPQLVSGQFGESHHVLICRFLLQFDNVLDEPDKQWNHCSSLSLGIVPSYALDAKSDENKTNRRATTRKVPEHQTGKKGNSPPGLEDGSKAIGEVTEDETARKVRLLYEIEDLLSWYQRPGQHARPVSPNITERNAISMAPPSLLNRKELRETDSKKNVTSVISAAFRSTNHGAPLETLSVKWPAYVGISTHLFKYIHASLGLVTWYPGPPYTSFPERWSNYKDLISPAHTAKHWLNRYFRLTKQFGMVESSAEKSIDDTFHKYKAMPKNGEIDRMAVIYIRRTLETGSSVGRIMELKDDPILKHVLDSISQANKLCDQIRRAARRPVTEDDEMPPTRFSHVMVRLLYYP